jgi:hypothetical protein
MMKPVLRRCAAIGVAVGLSVGLAGCDSSQNGDLTNFLSALVPATPAAPAASAPEAVPPPQASAIPGAQAAAIPTVPQLARFHDMRAADVEALVGDPDFRRVEPPAELWQYRTAECVVDLFFYGQGEDRRVVHEDARGRDPAHEDKSCGDGSEVFKDRLRG